MLRTFQRSKEDLGRNASVIVRPFVFQNPATLLSFSIHVSCSFCYAQSSEQTDRP